MNLPQGASYHAKSGRASLDVSRGDNPGTVYVYASCDSLEQQVMYFERLSEDYRKEAEQLKKNTELVKNTAVPVWKYTLYSFMVGMVLGLIVMIIITKKYQIWQT